MRVKVKVKEDLSVCPSPGQGSTVSRWVLGWDFALEIW